MIIDRETWLPIRVVRTYKGAVVEAWSLRDVRLDPPLLASDFSVQLPSSAELVTGGDQGFRRLSLARASNAVHGRLFVPSTLPDGFSLSLATVRTPEPTLQRPWLSDESTVASLVYRRGFRSVVVTSRSFRGGPPDPAVDPFVGSAARGTSGATDVLLRAGGLAGATAHLSARPLALPHLWVVQHGLLVTVAGDVTRRELRQIAESLETYGVWRTREAFTAYAAATRAYDLAALRTLYSDGVEIDGRSYSAAETDDAMIRNSEQADYFVSGEVVSAFVGRGTAVWEAWPGDKVAVGGWYSPEAVAEIVTVRGDRIAREEFFWITGPNLKAGEKSPHPARLRTSARPRRHGRGGAAGRPRLCRRPQDEGRRQAGSPEHARRRVPRRRLRRPRPAGRPSGAATSGCSPSRPTSPSPGCGRSGGRDGPWSDGLPPATPSATRTPPG